MQVALASAQLASRVTRTIDTLAGCVHELLTLHHFPKPVTTEELLNLDHQAIFLVLHEQCQYRDILKAVKSFHSLLSPECDGHKPIQFWIALFKFYACAAYGNFEKFPEGDDFEGLELSFSPDIIPEVRYKLMGAGLEMISTLTKSFHVTTMTISGAEQS